MQPHIGLLASHPVFSVLRSGDLIRLSEAATIVAHPAGAAIFAKGQPGDAAYMVVSGHVQIFIPGYDRLVVLAKLGPSDVFGEEALLTGAPRSASARAFSAAVLLRIDRETFVDLLERCRALREEVGTLVRERQAARLVSSSGVLQRLMAADVGGTAPGEKRI